MKILSLFEKYIKLYPEEAADLQLLREQLNGTDDAASRKNFIGHVTASAFIINEHTHQVLLLEHKTLAKLLQPGGHLEPGRGLVAVELAEPERAQGAGGLLAGDGRAEQLGGARPAQPDRRGAERSRAGVHDARANHAAGELERRGGI